MGRLGSIDIKKNRTILQVDTSIINEICNITFSCVSCLVKLKNYKADNWSMRAVLLSSLNWKYQASSIRIYESSIRYQETSLKYYGIFIKIKVSGNKISVSGLQVSTMKNISIKVKGSNPVSE